jgi:hypothetical protein
VEEQQECSRITERRRTSLQQRFKEAVVDSDNLIQKNLIHTIECRRKEEDTTATTLPSHNIARRYDRVVDIHIAFTGTLQRLSISAAREHHSSLSP